MLIISLLGCWSQIGQNLSKYSKRYTFLYSCINGSQPGVVLFISHWNALYWPNFFNSKYTHWCCWMNHSKFLFKNTLNTIHCKYLYAVSINVCIYGGVCYIYKQYDLQNFVIFFNLMTDFQNLNDHFNCLHQLYLSDHTILYSRSPYNNHLHCRQRTHRYNVLWLLYIIIYNN